MQDFSEKCPLEPKNARTENLAKSRRSTNIGTERVVDFLNARNIGVRMGDEESTFA